jgi:hypothetical protein
MTAHAVFNDALLDTLRNTGDTTLDGLLLELCERKDGDWSLGRLFMAVHDLPRLSTTELDSLRAKGMITSEIVDFFADNYAIPDLDWIDHELVRVGGRFYRDRGIVGFMVLAFASLPACYCWSTEAEVLAYTGKLAERTDVPRRLPETAQFVLDVSEEGALRPHGLGIHSAHKIRLLHGIIRHLVREKDAQRAAIDTGVRDKRRGVLGAAEDYIWDHPGEVPVSQELLASTLLTFHYIVLDGMRKLGVNMSEREIRGYLQRWNVVGYFLGIDERILSNLASEQDARLLLELIMQRKRRKTDAGIALEASLLAYMRSNILERTWLGRLHPVIHVPPVLTSFLSGADTCKALGLELNALEKSLSPGILAFSMIVGMANNYRLPRFVTGRLLATVTHKIWGWRHDVFRGPVPPDRPPQKMPDGEIVVPASLAEAWHVPGRSRARVMHSAARSAQPADSSSTR